MGRYFSCPVISPLRKMVRIYRVEDSEKATRGGYEATYVADLTFQKSLDSCGVILVDFETSDRSSPHAHEHLEEVFVALSELSIYVNDIRYDLHEGDVAIVEPGEFHSFERRTNTKGRILALKFPNIKDDKVVPVRGSEG